MDAKQAKNKLPKWAYQAATVLEIVLVVLVIGAAIWFFSNLSAKNRSQYPLVSKEIRGQVQAVPRRVPVNAVNDLIRGHIGDGIRFGDECTIYAGDVLVAVAEIRRSVEHAHEVLVEYQRQGEVVSPPECPTGTLFFISKEKWERGTDEFNRIEAEKEKERAFIRDLLK